MPLQLRRSSRTVISFKPGDTLEVSVLQDPKLNRQVVIAPDGSISFPLAGHFQAAGKTMQALEKEFSKRLSKNYLSPPQVTVMLSATGQSPSSQVFIMGEVNKPGPVPISPGMNVMQAIALSGGFGKFAAKSRIQIHRQDQVFLFDYSDFESGRNLQGNIPLTARRCYSGPGKRTVQLRVGGADRDALASVR